jgi:hypothetical protein
VRSSAESYNNRERFDRERGVLRHTQPAETPENGVPIVYSPLQDSAPPAAGEQEIAIDLPVVHDCVGPNPPRSAYSSLHDAASAPRTQDISAKRRSTFAVAGTTGPGPDYDPDFAGLRKRARLGRSARQQHVRQRAF